MADSAQQTAFDPGAPKDERVGALATLQKGFMPGGKDLLPSDAVMETIDWINGRYAEQDFQKAINPRIVPFPSKRSKDHDPGIQSVTLDNFSLSVNGDYWERPGALSADSMREMNEQTPILDGIIRTRVRQVQRFCRISESADTPGFEIRHIDRQHQLTDAERESTQLLNRFFANCGWEFNPRRRKKLGRDSLANFMAKSVRDSLEMDSAPIETEWKRDKALGLDGFYAVDGATIRLCTENGYQGDDQIHALQVVQGRICTAYTYDDLIYEARNPRTDVSSAGYGLSETETLIRVVTGFLNAMTYNIVGFDRNSIPKGVMHLSGQYSQSDVDAMKRYWNAMVKGVSNAWTLPLLFSKDEKSAAKFEKFGVDFSEMAFAKWMTFLTSIACAIHGMSPSEINFDSFTGGTTSALSGSDTEQKLAASRDSGLHPLMAYYENTFTDFICTEFSDRFCFRWSGLRPEDDARRFEKQKLILTVDEMRAEEGYEAHPNKQLGSAPLNATLVSPWMQLNGMAGQQPGAGEGEGADEDKGEKDFGGEGNGEFADQQNGFGSADEFNKSLRMPVVRAGEW
jgi:hypothetical protein